MKFTPEANDFRPAVKTESTLKLQDLDFAVEELEDEAAAISGGVIITASSVKPFSLSEYYKTAGFWGG